MFAKTKNFRCSYLLFPAILQKRSSTSYSTVRKLLATKKDPLLPDYLSNVSVLLPSLPKFHSGIMPPKKRPLDKKANSNEETENVEESVQPSKIRKTKKNENLEHEKADGNIEPKPKKAAVSKKVKEDKAVLQDVAELVEEKKTKSKAPTKKPTKEATKDKEKNESKPKKNVKKNEEAQVDSEPSEEPPKKRGRVKKEETPVLDENDSSDQEEVDEKKTKSGEKKAKPTKPDKKLAPEKIVKKNKETKTDKKDNDKKDSKKSEKDEETKNKKVEKEKPTKKAPVKKKVTANGEKKTVNESSNNTETDWEKIDFNSDKKNAEGNVGNFKITSWNVDGIRAWLKKDGLNILTYGSPDILCLQETKCNEESIPVEIANFDGYKKYWCSSDKNGYAGVGLLTKKDPIDVTFGIGDKDQDEDGRCITAEFEDFYLVTVYVPNAGRKLVTLDKRLDWNESFKDFVKELDKKKPVIICGDMNVAHNEIDLKNPKTNTKNAGFTVEEREGMSDFLKEGFIDTFRALYPDQKDSYTFWSYMMSARKKNIGWRLDYFLVSERIKNKVCDNVIHDKVFGSDHCPLTLFINI